MVLFGSTSSDQNDRPDGRLERYLKKLAAGEKDALQPLYAETRSAVYGFALSILKNAPDAEDVLQDTYLQISAAAGGYHPRGKPMAWILTITKNLARMRLREKSRLAEWPEDGEEPPHLPPVAEEDRIVLEAALRALSDEESQIVMLYVVSGLKHREIAAMLELPLPTVLSKYHRALKKLKKHLSEEVV